MSITRTEFTSGLRVVTERMPGVRSVSIGVWVLAGSRDERPAISGHCHFLEHLLFKGTDRRTALQIAEDFDAVGGDVNAFTAKEYTCYYARVLDRDLEMAVDHLVDMLQHSRIAATDLTAETDVILSEIDMHEDSPEDLVHDVFTEALWPGHPLGRPILGTKDRIKGNLQETYGKVKEKEAELESNLRDTVAGLLLQSQLALAEPSLPPQLADKLRLMADLAGSLRKKLDAGGISA